MATVGEGSEGATVLPTGTSGGTAGGGVRKVLVGSQGQESREILEERQDRDRGRTEEGAETEEDSGEVVERDEEDLGEGREVEVEEIGDLDEEEVGTGKTGLDIFAL